MRIRFVENEYLRNYILCRECKYSDFAVLCLN